MDKGQNGNFIDLRVGRRLRSARKARGFLPAFLAEQLGITVEELQEYEGGDNRISPDLLDRVASVLGVQIGYFFAELDDTREAAVGPGRQAGDRPAAADPVSSPEGLELIRTFAQIRDPVVRRRAIEIVRWLAHIDSEGGGS